MTTGSWFVFCKAQQCPHCERIYPEFEALSQDEELSENGIVFATVDVPSNRATATRFDIRYENECCLSGFIVYIFSPHYRWTRHVQWLSIVSLPSQGKHVPH